MLSEETKERLYHNYKDINEFIEDEFLADVNRIVLIAKLLDKWYKHGNTNYRLLLNHVIILNNVFGSAGLYALYEYIENFKELIPCLVSVCYYLGLLENVPAIYDTELLENLKLHNVT